MPKCPMCGKELVLIYTSKRVNLVWTQGQWTKSETNDETFLCSLCHEELDADDLTKLGVPNDLR